VYEATGADSRQYGSQWVMHTHLFQSPNPKGTWPSLCNCTMDAVDGICSQQQVVSTATPVSDAYHVTQLLWNETDIIVYQDGELMWRVQNDCMHQPMELLFDRETMPDWFGLPPVSSLPDRPYIIDYIHAWKSG